MSPLTSHCTCPGSSSLPGRERRAADHAGDVAGERLLVADAVHHGRDRAVGERVRGRLRSPTRRASPWWRRCRSRTTAVLRRRSWRGGGRARRRRPESVSPFAFDRVDVRLVEVECPDLDVVERRQVGGEQRADRAAADDADSHVGSLPRRRRREPRQRELASAGDSGWAQDQHRRHRRRRRRQPRSRWQVERRRRRLHPRSARPRNESSPLTASAPTRRPRGSSVPPTTSIARLRNVSSR